MLSELTRVNPLALPTLNRETFVALLACAPESSLPASFTPNGREDFFTWVTIRSPWTGEQICEEFLVYADTWEDVDDLLHFTFRDYPEITWGQWRQWRRRQKGRKQAAR